MKQHSLFDIISPIMIGSSSSHTAGAVAGCQAELSLSGIETKISSDEVVDTMIQTGQLRSPLLKETSQGGLATTKSGKLINENINKLFIQI